MTVWQTSRAGPAAAAAAAAAVTVCRLLAIFFFPKNFLKRVNNFFKFFCWRETASVSIHFSNRIAVCSTRPRSPVHRSTTKPGRNQSIATSCSSLSSMASKASNALNADEQNELCATLGGDASPFFDSLEACGIRIFQGDDHRFARTFLAVGSVRC